MSLLSQANFAAQVVKANVTKNWIPLTVSLTVTNRCNIDCIYCYGEYPSRKIEDFSTEFWCNLVDELYDMGTRLIHLEGGEPLMRNDIGELINYIKDKGMLCRINSNGYLVPKKIEEIKRIDSICLSIDGYEEANDKNRGKGCYQKVIKAIIAAKEQGLPVLTSTTLTSHNIDDGSIEHVLELAQKYKFGAQFNFLYDQTTDISDDPAVIVKEQAIKDTVTKLIGYKKEGLPIFYSYATFNNVLNWPVSYNVRKFTSVNPHPDDFNYITCYMGKLMCFVDGDGKVYPCGEHIDTFPALNILDVGFKKAWENVAEKKDCYACYNTCFDEYNEIFSLKPSVWWNNFKNYVTNKG